jgi:hypothetical protein
MKHQNHIQFTERLIKGRIAETIFEQMLLATEHYTVLKGGYEHTMPLVAQISPELENTTVLDGIKKSPDFVVILNDSQDDHRYIYLVEVKYRKFFKIDAILKEAEDIQQFWPHSYLFVATNDGFFMDKCSNIIKDKYIQSLSEDIVSKDLQDEYLNILKKFLG